MKSRSQAGQDVFAYEVNGRKRDGVFLEIGTNDPVSINNTFALEELGWRGLLVDNSPDSMLACEKLRVSPFYLTDASKPQDWLGAFAMMDEAIGKAAGSTHIFDYGSFDIDFATLECLRNLPLKEVAFRVITVETDLYRNGQAHRDAIHSHLFDHGYALIAADVCDQGLPFESWFVMPEMVNMDLVERFRSSGKDWREVVK
jgi:hypothetical protein